VYPRNSLILGTPHDISAVSPPTGKVVASSLSSGPAAPVPSLLPGGPVPGPAEPPPPTRPVAARRTPVTEAFGIFEGGGAKGVAHLGALKAAEDLNVRFVGLAGTSAGAIVAALAAAGYRADELIRLEPTPPEHALQRICNVGPTSLFGMSEWQRFVRFRRAINRPQLRLIPWPQIGLLNWILLLVIVPTNLLLRAIWLVARCLVLLWCAIRYGWKVRRAYTNRGWFDTDTVRPYLNALLHHRLRGSFDPPLNSPGVVFSDLPADRPLRIVATDIRSETQNIKVFSNVATGGHAATPDVAIADAVAASIAVPFIFAPKIVNGNRLVDGGLVSNLPVWLFDEERLERPKLPTIAFTLVGEAEAADQTFLQYTARILRTGIFGAQNLARRGIDNLIIVPVPCTLKLLDFDASWEKVRPVYERAREAARATMAGDLIDRPREMRDLCRMMHGFLAGPSGALRLRINIVRQVSPKYLRVQFSYNMDTDADDSIFIPFDRSISGEAWESKRIICRVGPANMRFAASPFADDKYRQALLWKDLYSVISIPVFASADAWDLQPTERPNPIAVVNVDADASLEAFMASQPILEFLVIASDVIARALLRQ
jgi:NTE family protein